MTQSVTLRKMNENEYVQWKEWSISDYAQSLVQAEQCSEANARAQAELDFSSAMNDIPPQNNFLLIAENIEGVPVGMIWYETKNPKWAFVADFLVYDAYRRMGYGSAILAQAERNIQSSKILSIALHVFAHNTPAIKLYKKCGFVIEKADNGSIYMKKQLY